MAPKDLNVSWCSIISEKSTDGVGQSYFWNNETGQTC